MVAGGLVKNKLLMQIYADVTRLPLSVIGSDQGPALGSAIHAAVAAGAYPDVHAAAAAMGARRPRVYVPDEDRADAYDALFAEYCACTTTSAAEQRRDAPARRHQASGDRPMSGSNDRRGDRASPGDVQAVREQVTDLHAELVRNGLVGVDERERVGARTRS